MPRVVIEEFVKDLDDDEKEHSDNDNEEKAEKPHKLLDFCTKKYSTCGTA